MTKRHDLGSNKYTEVNVSFIRVVINSLNSYSETSQSELHN